MCDPLVALIDEPPLVRLDPRGFGPTRHDAGRFGPTADVIAVLEAVGAERDAGGRLLRRPCGGRP